jgi:hypothetical protein
VTTILIALIGVSAYALMATAHRMVCVTSCCSQQRQISLSALIYANDDHGRWPTRPSDPLGRLSPAHPAGFATAAASLEQLAACPGADLLVREFRCPAERTIVPPPLAFTGQPSDAMRLSAWAVAGPARMSYCYDWSVPADAQAIRVVLCDRGMAHGDRIVGACADGHVVEIHVHPGTHPATAHTTLGLDGSPETTLTAPSPDTGDDPYDDDGDGPGMGQPGGGSTTRAWVR